MPAMEKEEELEPLTILERRLAKRGNSADAMGLILWKGKSPLEATWEFLSDLRLRLPYSPLWAREALDEGTVTGD